MRRLLCPAGVLLVLLLCGCDDFYYTFDTFIAMDGTITRTIDFSYSPYEKTTVVEEPEDQPDGAAGEKDDEEAPANGKEDVEADIELGMPESVIMPDRDRFFEFELREHGLRGVWQSDGVIHTDFRFAAPSYTVRGKPGQRIPRRLRTPRHQREAYNEGEVITTDFVVIKTFSYVERFHDYYTPEEFDRYGDIAIERLAAFFLEVLRTDLGRDYDLREFERYFREHIIPFAKKWKGVLYSNLLYEYDIRPGERDEGLAALRSPTMRAMARELMALGALDEPFLDPDKALMTSWDWLRLNMHNLIVRKRDKSPWSYDAIDAYFSDDAEKAGSTFSSTSYRIMERRYGDEMGLTERLLAIWDSYAETGSDSHHFEMVMTSPGTLIHATPDPKDVTVLNDQTTIKWEFKNDRFFPGGVTLSCVTAAPNVEAQKRLFGGVVLSDKEAITTFLAHFSCLTGSTRSAVLAGLRECVESGDLEELFDTVYDRLPEQLQELDEENLDDLLLFLEDIGIEDSDEPGEVEEAEIGEP